MRNRIINGSFRVMACIGLLAYPTGGLARSIFEGLELVGSEGSEGVEIINLDNASPAAKAALEVGDRIVQIDSYRIRNLDDFVKVSRRYGGRKSSSSLVYYRGGERRRASLSLYSDRLKGKWGVTVVPRRGAVAGAAPGSADHWLAEARRRIALIRRKPGKKISPEDYGKAIHSLYTALDRSPQSIETATLIARQYGKLSELYAERGERKKAVWCLRRALLMYSNALRKAEDFEDLSRVRNGLAALRKSVSRLH